MNLKLYLLFESLYKQFFLDFLFFFVTGSSTLLLSYWSCGGGEEEVIEPQYQNPLRFGILREARWARKIGIIIAPGERGMVTGKPGSAIYLCMMC